MAIRDILFHLDTGDTARSVSEFAVSLAATTGAHLTAVGLAIQYLASGGFEDAQGIEYLMEITDKCRSDAEAAYAGLVTAAPAGVQTDFVLIETPSAIARDRFGALARHFDLSVVGQGSQDAGYEDRLMATGALFGSGRPVFIVPNTHRGAAKLDKAMVCWDGSVAAARALAGAIPLLKRAQTTEVVSIERKGEPAEQLPGFNVTRHLARHGVNAKLKKLPYSTDVGASLMTYSETNGADFMVMGGYGHWRLRELVLGGATRTILAAMKTPVLMAH